MRADCLPHASVFVRVNNEPLPEHHAEDASADDNMTATSFIEAVPGAQFTVYLLLDAAFAYRNPKDKLSFKVFVDGERVKESIVSTHALPIAAETDGQIEVNYGITTLKRLTFAEHTPSDDHAKPSLVEKFTKIGQIKVELTRCRELASFLPAQEVGKFKGVDDEAIPEKALKGRSISSHTKLGHPEPVIPTRWVTVSYPYGGGPIATYVFQYRSRRDLEIEGILERPPSPVPLIDRSSDDLTPDELREQVRLLRAARASTVKIKQESKREKRTRQRSGTIVNEDDEDSDVTITDQTNRRKRARASVESAEVVDLTED